MRKRVRLGIIGAGGIGHAHLQASRECKGVEAAAVCDVDEARAKAAAAEFQVPHVFTDYRGLLRDDLVDAVVVCTPNNVHMPVTIAALKAGKHVLCEKPLAMNARQARQMVEAAKKTRRILMTAQSARYSAAARFAKKLVDGGRLGEVYYGQALWLRRRGIPRGWFQDVKQSGGGPLIDLGVHAVDLMWWLMGRPTPVSAYGVTSDHLGRRGEGMGDWGIGYSPAEFSVEDMVAGIVRFDDGRAVGLHISWAAHTGDLYWLRIFGTKGGAQLYPDTVVYQTENQTMVEARPQLPKTNSYAEELQHFVTCIQRGEEPISPGSQAVVVMDMLDGIYRSAQTGRAIPLGRS